MAKKVRRYLAGKPVGENLLDIMIIKKLVF
jgi:hypothetical protein